MNEAKPTANKSGDAEKSNQLSVFSTGASARSSINTRMVQNVLLIWLDSNIDQDNGYDYHNAVTQLRRVVNSINTFTNSDECIAFIETINYDKACLIISDSLGQNVVPRVHDMSQVDSIFILCSSKYHWTEEWPKIKGVFTEITSICKTLEKAVSECEHNAISINFMATNGDISKKKLDPLDCSFICMQILKEILLSTSFEQQHIQEYIDYCRDVFVDNVHKLNKIKNFERNYRDQTPIWWYTRECFLYPMLNRALRTMDIDLIIKIGFFIGDLHRQIEQRHSEQFHEHHSSSPFTVYRGQGLSKADFEQMSKTTDGLMAFNNFLFTSKNRNKSLDFARRSMNNPDLVGILFIMTIDPSKSNIPFTSIKYVDFYEDKENEVLFAMGTVFRIRDIKPMDENHRLFQVDLTLTGDDDEDLRVLTERIQEDNFPDEEGWYRLGLVLLKLGQYDKAQQIHQLLLKQATTESNEAPLYRQLGFIKYNQGDYEEAIKFHEKSLEIEQKLIPLRHRNLTNSYINIGNVYEHMGEYSKALSSYEKALVIKLESLPPNHSDLASTYINVGIVYYNLGEYMKALSSYKKALAIQQASLPPNHPDLTLTYENIGFVYGHMSEYSKALSSYEKVLIIKQESLPPNHSDLAPTYNNIGSLHGRMEEYAKALPYFEKALAIRQQSLPPNHPDLAATYNNLGAVYEDIGDYSKARSFFDRAVDIGQVSLPSNHPDLQDYRDNLEELKNKL